MSVKAEKIVTRGVNQWDEEWEVGAIDTSTGQDYASSTMVRCQGYIPVTGGATYYFKIGSKTMQMMQFDANHTFLTGWNGPYSHKGFTASGEWTLLANCAYIRFQLLSTTTYDGDICINISDPAINGQYFPHHSSDVGLPILKHFPTGLRGVGDSYDEIGPKKKVQRRAVVDLGTLNWTYSARGFFASTSNLPNLKNQTVGSLLSNLACSKYAQDTASNIYSGVNDKVIGTAAGGPSIWVRDSAYTDAVTFKAAMSGVYLDYPLADPIVTDIDEQMTYLPDEGGTEEISPITAPFTAEIRYARLLNENAE